MDLTSKTEGGTVFKATVVSLDKKISPSDQNVNQGRDLGNDLDKKHEDVTDTLPVGPQLIIRREHGGIYRFGCASDYVEPLPTTSVSQRRPETGYPVVLMCSGRRCFDGAGSSTPTTSVDINYVISGREQKRFERTNLPSERGCRPGSLPISHLAATDFGFRRSLMSNNAGASYRKLLLNDDALRRDIAAAAHKHIYATQRPGTMYRSSRVAYGMTELKETLLMDSSINNNSDELPGSATTDTTAIRNCPSRGSSTLSTASLYYGSPSLRKRRRPRDGVVMVTEKPTPEVRWRGSGFGGSRNNVSREGSLMNVRAVPSFVR